MNSTAQYLMYLSELKKGSGGGNNDFVELVEGTIKSVNNSDIKNVHMYAFVNQSNLTTVNLPNVTSIGNWAFNTCQGLVTISFPNVISVGSTAFGSCNNLVSIDLPKATSIGGSCFSSCASLTSANIPNLNTIPSSAFSNSKAFVSFDASKATSIGKFAFANCSKFQTLVLRSSSLCSLENINAFDGSPFASNGTGGTLYVPSDLIESYQSADNWSTILGYANNNILSIEGSEYE